MPILHNQTYNKLKSNIHGLLFLPSFDQSNLNNYDGTLSGKPCASSEFSVCNQTVLKDILLNNDINTIVEIGVYRHEPSAHFTFGTPHCPSTVVILEYKKRECKYLGIDLDNKDFLKSPENNIFTIQENSAHVNNINQYMLELDITTIDLLIIDGYHSVNMAFNDWIYTERLSENGIVLIHDTNRHPGPMLLFDAIDPEVYDKEKSCTEYDDNGIAIIRKRNEN